ncbi:hypothetical protein HDU67_010007, partial [Dinochytrium kinnereticum]
MRRPWNDEDDDDDDFSSRLPKKRALSQLPASLFESTSASAPSISTPTPAPAVADEDDEVDPLDAFMAGINTEVQKQDTQAKPKAHRADLEEEDHVESYINLMKSKGVEVGKGSAKADEYADSDEEVYATAKAMEGK